MPESAAHADLVQAIVRYAGRQFGGFGNIVVMEDAVRPVRGERPPKIEGYVPDVFVTDVPTTTTLIGEAKPANDVESIHTRRQLLAFLSYLSNTPNGILVLSVPLVAGATARRVLAQVSGSLPRARTLTVVLDGINAEEP